jgi:hypothetical protein
MYRVTFDFIIKFEDGGEAIEPVGPPYEIYDCDVVANRLQRSCHLWGQLEEKYGKPIRKVKFVHNAEYICSVMRASRKSLQDDQ